MPEAAAADILTLDVKRIGSATVVRCHGKLVAGVNNLFYDRIKQLLPDTKRIVLDLSDLTRMDSTGLGALVRLYVSARSAGCTLELTHLGKQVRELLGLTNLLSAFSIIGEHGIKLG